MKYLIYFSLLILFGFTAKAQTATIMTYNLRYDNPKDGINCWNARKNNVINLLEKYNPDVFGTQEGLNHQLDYLNTNLTDYTYVGVGRDDGKEKGEYCAIFYKKDKYKLLKQSTFWLSNTPDKISVGWDAVLERICTYALLQNRRNGNCFYVFNAHLDHIGKIAQYKSSMLIVEKIKEINIQNYPALLMGDLNLNPDNKAIKYLSTEMFDTNIKNKKNATMGTFNAFKHEQKVADRIDYIFTNDKFAVKNNRIIDDKIDMRYPSDHLPVLAKMRCRKH